MALVRGGLTVSRRARNWGLFAIDADVSRPMDMLSATLRAVNVSSMLAFLEGPANRFMTQEILERFDSEGDTKSGDWPALTQATERIRESLGFPPSHPINQRTGELLQFVSQHREFHVAPQMASMDIPGKPQTASVEYKLLHAQLGTAVNPMIPGAVTPPRPVLAYDAGTMEVLLKLLQVHIIFRIAEMM